MSMRSATAKSIALLQPTRGRRGLIDGILTMARAYRQAWERRTAAETLKSLDARMLKDIGIDRSEIMSVVYGTNDGTSPSRLTVTPCRTPGSPPPRSPAHRRACACRPLPAIGPSKGSAHRGTKFRTQSQRRTRRR